MDTSRILTWGRSIILDEKEDLPERYPRQLNAIMERYGKKCIAA